MRRVVALLLAVLFLTGMLPAAADSFNYHKATAFMDIKFECGCTRTGTGAMIGRRGLITCAHNLFCHVHGKGLKYCNFVFGAKSVNSGLKKYNGTFSYWAFDTFSNGYDSTYDIGYVVFNNPVGDSTGWYGTWIGSDEDLNMEFTNLNYYTSTGRFNDLYTVQYVKDSFLLTLDEYPYSGGDGAPVFMTGEGGFGPKVVGVYITSGSGKGFARRLTSDVIDRMRKDGAFD